jgi:O-antigen ligase
VVKATKLLFLLLFFLTPLAFTTFNSELFEVPKMYLVYLFTVLILFFHIINYFKGRVSLVSKSPLNLPILLFLLIQIISTIFSVDVHTSFFGYYSRLNGGLLSLLTFSLLFFILVNYLDEKFKQDIIKFSLISGFIVATYGVLEHFGIDARFWLQDVQTRVFSTLGQPNWLSAYLCILLPLAIYQYHHSSNKKLTTYFLLLITTFFLCLLFTKSKSGIIAAIISLGIYYFFNLKTTISRKSFIFLPILFLVLCLTISNPIKDFLFPQKTITENQNINNLNITPSEDIRKIVWTGAIKLWQKYPILGTGPETFAYTYYSVRPAAHNLTSEWEFLYNKVHNEYLNYLANTGTLGLLTYLLFIFSSGYLFISRRRWELLAAYLSILITNFAGFSVVVVSLFFFLLPALCLNSSPPPPSAKFRWPLLILTFIFSLYALKQIFSFFLADISLAQGDVQDNQNQYVKSYRYLLRSHQLNPRQPVYLSRLSVLSAKLAAAYFLQKDTSLALKFATDSAQLSDLSLTISPLNINFLKERTQALTYLSTIDPQYLTQGIATLQKTAILAPTDAKTFYLLAKFYDATGNPTETETNYLKAIDLKSNYDLAYFDLGLLYFNQKKYDLAKKYFELNLQYSPGNQNALDYLKKIK